MTLSKKCQNIYITELPSAEGMLISPGNLYLSRCPLIPLYILPTNLHNTEVRLRESSYPNLPRKPLIYHLLWLWWHAERFQRTWRKFWIHFIRKIPYHDKTHDITAPSFWTLFERKWPWFLYFVLCPHPIYSPLTVSICKPEHTYRICS